MHPRGRVEEALALAAEGYGGTEVARRTGIARGTVRDWMAGTLPHSARRDKGGCPRCGAEHPDLNRTADAYVYLLGMYLGDGCLSEHPRRVFKLRIVLDTRYPAIIETCRTAVAAVMPRVSVATARKQGCVEVYAYSKSWPCLFPQHGPGAKHTRRIVLAPWQEELVVPRPEPLLRGLIHSDGSRFTNTGRGWRHPRYAFCNHSEDIRGLFCAACDRLGLRWTLAPHTVYVSRMADVARLDEFVGPKE